MEVICLQEDAFYELVNTVVERMKEQINSPKEDKWIPASRAMEMLNIKSKTSLQKLRNEGAIIYSQPQPKIILYDRESILDYLDENAKNTF